LFEDNEQKIAALRKLPEEVGNSGTSKYSYEALMNELDDELG
jgi:antitoxin ParD1/3/4